jgi:hypothetical protein
MPKVILQAEIDHLNRTVCKTTCMSLNDRWDRALQDGMTAMQPVPSTAMLDLHLALHDRRRRNTDNPVDFEGRSWAIAPTLRKTVSISSTTRAVRSGSSPSPQSPREPVA